MNKVILKIYNNKFTYPSEMFEKYYQDSEQKMCNIQKSQQKIESNKGVLHSKELKEVDGKRLS
jgi:hypothetical protein